MNDIGRRGVARRASPPTARSQAALRRAHLAPVRAVPRADRPQPDRAVAQGRRPAARQLEIPTVARASRVRQWSPPRICSTACTSSGPSTASPSRTPPGEPGQVHDQRASGHAGQPARQHRRRHALRDAVRRAAPPRCPAGSRRAPRAVISGVRSVGRDAGAAGGDDHVVRRRDRRRAAPPRRGRRPAPPPGRPPSNPSATSPSTSTGPAAVVVRRRRPPGWTRVTTSALMVRTPRLPRRSAASRPDAPPRLRARPGRR